MGSASLVKSFVFLRRYILAMPRRAMKGSVPNQIMIIIHYRAVFLLQMMPHCFVRVEAAMVFQSGAAIKAVPVVHVRIHLSKTPRALDKTNVFRPEMFNGFPNIIHIFIMLVA